MAKAATGLQLDADGALPVVDRESCAVEEVTPDRVGLADDDEHRARLTKPLDLPGGNVGARANAAHHVELLVAVDDQARPLDHVPGEDQAGADEAGVDDALDLGPFIGAADEPTVTTGSSLSLTLTAREGMAADGVCGLLADPHQVEGAAGHRLAGGRDCLYVRVAEEVPLGVGLDGEEAPRVLRLELFPQLLLVEALAPLDKVLPPGYPFGLPLEILGRGLRVFGGAVLTHEARRAA